MLTQSHACLFDRAGLAARSDLDAAGYGALFAELEPVQTEFLRELASFRDPRYGWESDTLHNWSRAWEYAFMLHHIGRERARLGGAVRAIDFGSGSTFFPFAIARRGIDLICFDNDPVVVGDLRGALNAIDAAPGTIEVRQNGETLPCEDNLADIAYSVSVLEHMPNPVPIVQEIARVLKPGGLFVLTMDIDVEGSEGVSPAHFNQLRSDLETFFSWEFPERTVHPLDVLTSKNSPWPRPGERHVPGLLIRTKDRRLLPLVGGPNPGVLTVYACVLRRR